MAIELAQAYVDGLNGFVETVSSQSHNFDEIGQWSWGHYEEQMKLAGSNGMDFNDFQVAYVHAFVNDMRDVELNDGKMVAVRALENLNVDEIIFWEEVPGISVNEPIIYPGGSSENMALFVAWKLKQMQYLSQSDPDLFSFNENNIVGVLKAAITNLQSGTVGGLAQQQIDFIQNMIDDGVVSLADFMAKYNFQTQETVFVSINSVLQIANDYHTYLENMDEINAQLSLAPESAFASWLACNADAG